MKLDYTFHSHTFRCGHAIGDIEDYVSLAIKHGYKIYGVSDHVFLPGVNEPRVRGDYHNPNEIEDSTALNQINKMIKKYNIKISDIKEVYKDYRKRIEYLCDIK